MTGVSLTPSTLSLTAGGASGTVTAVVSPSDATVNTVSFKSADTKVFTVSGSGLKATVTPVAAGSANLTVTTTDGSKTASCKVTVAAQP